MFVINTDLQLSNDILLGYSYCGMNITSIPLKPYFKGFCWGTSNINDSMGYIYVTYNLSHKVHPKGLTVNIWFKL